MPQADIAWLSQVAKRARQGRGSPWRWGWPLTSRRDTAAGTGLNGPGCGGPEGSLLSVRGLSVRFDRVWALDRIDMAVNEGEVVALAGENGAGKTTLARCVAGDVAASGGEIRLAGRPVPSRPKAAARMGIAFVRQHVELCDNLDVASNLFLGSESRGLFFDQLSLYRATVDLLAQLRIPLPDMTAGVGTLSGGARQLLTVAKAMLEKPRLLVLDEPTFSLGVNEAARVEELVSVLHEQGTTILLVSHDVDQMFRLADRIVLLRHGQIIAEANPRTTHRDDVVALLSGQQVESSARRQLARLQGLVEQLASTDSAASLSVILSSLGAALKSRCLSVHLMERGDLRCTATLGFPLAVPEAWDLVAGNDPSHPVACAARGEQVLVDEDLVRSPRWERFRELAQAVGAECSLAVPVMGASGLIGVITVLRPAPGPVLRDELDLARLYAGYAAAALERDRLLNDLTSRNSVLETIREVLETLAGPVAVADGLSLALKTLRHGLQADQTVLVTRKGQEEQEERFFGDGCAPGTGTSAWPGGAPDGLPQVLESALAAVAWDGRASEVTGLPGAAGRCVAVPFATGGGTGLLLAVWGTRPVPEGATALMEDAAHSLQLALEREEAAVAHQEAAALRRSQELQQAFLYLLSHELRTPLTAIRGYASSLLQPDVIWDGGSQQRFLSSIAGESARLGRLVEDLLDFSAIEGGILRLHNDWCEIPLVLEAAVQCVPLYNRDKVEVDYPEELPPVWADHDRLEQVVLNLVDNALRHNPGDLRVKVSAAVEGEAVAITVQDNGAGVPEDIASTLFDPTRRRRASTAGAGLGLSITRGIVAAHGGRIEMRPLQAGTEVVVRLPIEGRARAEAAHRDGLVDEATQAGLS